MTVSLHKLCALIFVCILCVTCGRERVTSTPLEVIGSPVPGLSTPSTNSPAPPTDMPDHTPTSIPLPTQTAPAKATLMVPPTATPTATEFPSTQISSKDGMLMIYIPAGRFLMGSHDGDPGADADEKPAHNVDLDAYWIGQTEVTNAMYAIFLNDQGNQQEGGSVWFDTLADDPKLVKNDGTWWPKSGYEDFPVVEVTWYGARAYCSWIGGRLPTEAEWEKSARSSDGRFYPWGEGIDCQHAQYANCGGKTLPVGSKPVGASPYGLLDLSGNVWEWVADWYQDDYYLQSPAENPLGPETGVARVLRGGSYDYDWKHVRSANRRNNGPATSVNDYGFRCALDVHRE